MLLFIPIGWLGLSWLKASGSQLATEVREVYPLLVLAVPIPILQGLFMGVLNGRSLFRETNVISSAGAVLTAVLPLISAWYIGPHLVPVFSAVIVARLLMLGALAIAAKRYLALGAPKLTSRSELRRMIHFGGWMTVSSLVGPFLVFIDRLVIGALLGATAVGIYTIPFNLVSQMWIFPAAIGTALFPRLASADKAEAGRLMGLSVTALMSILLPVTAFLQIAAKPGLTLWLGEPIAVLSAPVAVILLLGFWINSLGQMPFIRLQSSGRTDVIALIHLAELIPYLACLYLLTMTFGLPGAAVAWTLRVLLDFIAMSWVGKMHLGQLGHVALAFSTLTLITGGLLIDTEAVRWFVLVLAVLTVPASALFIPRDMRSILLERSRAIFRFT
jgi:O-antigen/teichoic acid export membrane protein